MKGTVRKKMKKNQIMYQWPVKAHDKNMAIKQMRTVT